MIKITFHMYLTWHNIKISTLTWILIIIERCTSVPNIHFLNLRGDMWLVQIADHWKKPTMLAHENLQNSWYTWILLCLLNYTFCPVTICQVSRFFLRIWNRWLRRRLMSLSNYCSSSCLDTDEVNVHAWELADASGFQLKSE